MALYDGSRKRIRVASFFRAMCEIFKHRTAKDTRGTQLINFFSKPCKPTKKTVCAQGIYLNTPRKWQTFIEYCIQDVNVEMAIANKLNRFLSPKVSGSFIHWISELMTEGQKLTTNWQRLLLILWPI